MDYNEEDDIPSMAIVVVVFMWALYVGGICFVLYALARFLLHLAH